MGLQVDAETLRRWMLAQGLWSRERKRRRHRRRRERKEHFGEMVQMDGSFHYWLEERGPQGCLIDLVDDATNTTWAQLGEHPASQRFGIHLQPILRCQVLRRQRRREALTDRPTVLLAHQPQHLLPKLLFVSTIRWPSRAAVLQTRGAFLPIPLPQPLPLPAAHAHQPRRIHHPQLLAAHSRQHFYSSQLPLAHLRPPQSDLLSEVLLRGHFYRAQKGTLSSRRNSCPTRVDSRARALLV